MSDNNKKILANRIKEDLRKELASGDLAELSDYGLVADSDNFFSISEHHVLARKMFFKPSDVEKEDYDEIVNLIRQRLQLRDQALAKERQKKEKVNDDKLIGLCQKCGADCRHIENWYYWCNEDERMTSRERLDWFCGKCWQQEEKNYRQKSNKKNTVYKSEPKKSNLGDEHDYYFENGQWISLESGTPDPNTIESGDKEKHSPQYQAITKIFKKEFENKNNKSNKDVFISILREFFQSQNIKLIELLSGNDLSIKYNDGSETVGDASEIGVIRRGLEIINEKSLDQQKLEKLQASSSINPSPTNPASSSPTNYVPYLIGGAIVIVLLGAAFTSYRLIKRKK